MRAKVAARGVPALPKQWRPARPLPQLMIELADIQAMLRR
jgi:hypothetical protein